MFIKSLELNNFRNYESLEISFSKGVNILYGDNAQGKTNILEALYMCSTTKSLRVSKEKELIRFGCDEAHMRMYIENEHTGHKIDMHLKNSRHKGVAIDGIPVVRATDIYGMINIVSFSPDDLSMVKNGPIERRRFIDMELCQIDKTYMYNLASYNKVLTQRNNLLKQIENNKELISTLQIWDEQLLKFGKEIINRRRTFIAEIQKEAGDIHKRISNNTEELEIIYQPDVSEKVFEEKLFLNRDRDIILKVTSVGPHRDDIDFIINGESARKFGSQGQQRTVALTCKLAEIEHLIARTGNKPVLLLDDVLSELDRNRQTELLNSIKDIQTIITCTGLEEFVNERIKTDRIYHVEKGTVREEI